MSNVLDHAKVEAIIEAFYEDVKKGVFEVELDQYPEDRGLKELEDKLHKVRKTANEASRALSLALKLKGIYHANWLGKKEIYTTKLSEELAKVPEYLPFSEEVDAPRSPKALTSSTAATPLPAKVIKTTVRHVSKEYRESMVVDLVKAQRASMSQAEENFRRVESFANAAEFTYDNITGTRTDLYSQIGVIKMRMGLGEVTPDLTNIQRGDKTGLSALGK